MKISIKQKHGLYILMIMGVVCLFSFFADLKKESESKTMGLQERLPVEIDGWKLVSTDTRKGIGGFVSINELFQGGYHHPVHGYMAITLEYSSDSRRRYELHFPDICQEARGDNVIKFPPFQVVLDNGKSIPVAFLSWEYRLKSQKAFCAYWYVINGEASIHTLSLKIKQIFAGVLNRPEDSILVRIDMSYTESLTEKTVENKSMILKQFIKALYSGLSISSRRILYGI